MEPYLTTDHKNQAPPSQERLDFSCALFGPDGGLVSNAPHIPVHLGAMQEAVKYQVSCDKKLNLLACRLKPYYVFVQSYERKYCCNR